MVEAKIGWLKEICRIAWTKSLMSIEVYGFGNGKLGVDLLFPHNQEHVHLSNIHVHDILHIFFNMPNFDFN